MRHGKSSWDDSTLADRDRPLSRRGERDVPRIAERIKAHKVRPSLIAASNAKRTWQTARLVAETIGYPREFMHREPSLYLADAATLRAFVAALDDTLNSVLVCAHNPGVTNFANELAPRLTGNVPTSGCLIVDSDVRLWSEFSDSELTLRTYEFPKNLPDIE